nr:MAG TPA: tail assembly chaperone [Caudoviricetes sp.]
MTNLTPEEIDQLSVKDFDEILKVVVEIKGVPLK